MNTLYGTVVTFIVMTIISAYTLIKFIYLLEKHKPNITAITINEYYDYSHVFKLEDNDFKIAFGVEEHNSNSRDGKDDPNFVKWTPVIW